MIPVLRKQKDDGSDATNLEILHNGTDILARIPNPNAGPAFYTIASGVATRHFPRTLLNLPIPRMYAYSLNPLNHVGVEYIIEEKEGLPTYDLEAELVSSAGSVKSLDPALTEKFAFGLLTEARLWEGERASVNLDRGPWTTPLSYVAAIGINEIQ
ncbi:hypothetical protein GQ44DRAFT_754940 [Phaeosphaeriaceae sp. PMI808]|nr:hypothetical protein GQ44DRAFT_754940 [Phaeosphaeriaceae sp. PMI808]